MLIGLGLARPVAQSQSSRLAAHVVFVLQIAITIGVYCDGCGESWNHAALEFLENNTT